MKTIDTILKYKNGFDMIIRCYKYKIQLHLLRLIILVPLLGSITSCEDLVQVDAPRIEIVNEAVFQNDETAESALIGIYNEMVNSIDFASGGGRSVTFHASLSSDELYYLGSLNNEIEFNSNDLSIDNGDVFSLWEKGYKYIYFANSALQGLENSNALSEDMKNQLEGEAKFIRAFIYFYLANLYGDVPIITTTSNVEENRLAARSSVREVYNLIISDLKDAYESLSDNYSFSGGERIRANKFTASALLARVYLYLEEWTTAEDFATIVIDNSPLYGLESDINNVFLANNNEVILQLAGAIGALDAGVFLISPTASSANLAMSSELLSAFEIGDNRRVMWRDSIIIGGNTYHYPFKYKIQTNVAPGTEYTVLLRLAEQYLIRAEARAQQNDISGAQSDLNTIRLRAGLGITLANDKASLLLAIEQERQVELFTEWGHRWLDLKRTNRADAVLGPLRADWQSTDALYPIPDREIEVNNNLTQNPGY